MGTAGLAALASRSPDAGVCIALPLALLAFLAVVGVRDLLQTKHAILRNYPVAAHLRFLLENIRPEMRQYFFEADKDGSPLPARQAGARLSASEEGTR